MSAPKCLFIFYNSFSFWLTENLHKQKHFLKTRSTCFVYIIFFKMYNKKKIYSGTVPLNALQIMNAIFVLDTEIVYCLI